MERSAVDSFRSGVVNLNSWILFVIYAGSCGVDFTMCNGAVLYYHYRYRQSIAASGAIAFLYGIFAIFARGVGGWLSDKAYEGFSLRGRLWLLLLLVIAQGLVNVWFSKSQDLLASLWIMVVFAIVIQMSMGACFSLVPYVDGPNTGSVAGIVGAGGNVGGAVFAIVFMRAGTEMASAMERMGWLTCLSGMLTPLLVMKGYRGIFFGVERQSDSSLRLESSPLMVPGKLSASPHLVSLAKRKRERRR